MTNNRWSPIQYPAGIIAALLTVTSEVAQIPSMGFDPRKKVEPIGVPVNSPTTSFIASPSMSVRAFPSALRYMCSLESKHEYQFISILPPLLQLCHEILLESDSGAGEILSLCNEVFSVLLIGRAAVRF